MRYLDIFYWIVGAAMIALGAMVRVEIPIGTEIIPITGQSLGVLLVGAWFGSRNGVIAVLLYLLLGALGVPVFAGFSAGWDVLTGATGGYLWGFIPAAMLSGYLCWGSWGRTWWSSFLAMLLATSVLLAVGVPWLASFIGWETAFQAGFLRVLPGALLKAAIAALFIQWFPMARTSS